MKLTEIFCPQFEMESVATGFLPASHPFDFWVALRNGELYAVSLSLGILEIGHIGLQPLNDALYCESGNFIVGVGGGGVGIYDFEQGEEFEPCPQFAAYLYKADLWSETTLIGCGSNEFLVKIDLSNGQIDELVYVGEELTSLSIHPNQKHILYPECSGSDCRTLLLTLPRDVCVIDTFQIQGATSSFNNLGTRFFQFNKYVFCSEFPNMKKLWCFSEEEGFVESRSESDYAKAYTWSNPVFPPNSNLMICGSHTGHIYWWNFDEPAVVGQVKAHTQEVTNLALSSDGQHLLSCSKGGEVKLWRIEL